MPKKAKDLKYRGETLTKWESQVTKWELRSGQPFGDIFKIPALLQMIPTQHLEMIEFQFASELENYDSLVKAIKMYSHHKGLEKFSKVDPDKMDLDSAEYEVNAEQQAAYYRGVNLAYEDEGESENTAEHEYKDPVLCALFAKGVGKGRQQKGNRSSKGSGRGTGKGPGQWQAARGQAQPRSQTGAAAATAGANPHKDKICHYCQKKGHIIADCRDRIAGRPRTQRPRQANSLEEGDDYEAEDAAIT